MHHGNYQVAKSWKAVERYCKKAGDYIANIQVENAKMKKAKNNMDLLKMSAKEAVETGEINLIDLPRLIKAKQAFALLEDAKN